MKKVYSPLINTAFLALAFCQGAFGQQIEKSLALGLIDKNASFLNLSKEDVRNSIVTNAYFDKLSGMQLIYLQQSYLDVPVYNTIQVIAFRNDLPVSVSGNRIYKIEDLAKNEKAVAVVSAKEAVSAAAVSVNIPAHLLQKSPLVISKASTDNHKVEFALSTVSKENITAEMLWAPAENGEIKLAWQVKLLPENTSDHWMILIDANDATILGKDNLTVNCNWYQPGTAPVLPKPGLLKRVTEAMKPASPLVVNSASYRVIPFPAGSINHQGGTPVIVNNPWQFAGAGNPATTLNWHNDGTTEYAITRGNNVWAREDTSGDNSVGASAASTTPLPNLNFDFSLDTDQQPYIGDNLNFGITNLFYWNNILHDVTYQYGFDEVSGNFQNSNLGRGGVGNDYVIAEAQDGSATNNANFSTGADGSRPRMQMFLWDSNRFKKLKMNLPVAYAGVIIASVEGKVSTKNLLIDVGPVTGDIVLYNDDAGGLNHLACVAPANAAALAGKIALIDRGSCNFTVKIKNAQNAGAIAVLVINNVADELITMSGDDSTITIPALLIFQSDGNALKTLLAGNNTINVTLKAQNFLDGDFDNGIIVHEYAHGISNRLTGGAATPTCLQNKEQMGEGWSDYYALIMTTDWATATITDGAKPRPLGTYAIGEDPLTGGGIRSYPYSTDTTINPWSYGKLATITDSEEHTVGEIWASALWDMTWNMIQMDGINANLYNANGTGGNTASMKIVTFAMKLQPCSPGFLDGRDAILKADEILYNGKYSCAIWNAFARRGMGVNARQGSSNSTVDQVENFDVPSGAAIRKTVDKIQSAQNDILTYTFTVKAQCAGISNYKIVDTLSTNVTYVSGGAYNSANRTVTFQVANLAAMQSASFTLIVKVNTGTFFVANNQFSETVDNNFVPFTLVSTSDSASYKWQGSATNHSPAFSLKTASTTFPTEQILTSLLSYTISGHTQLSFWQKYDTEHGKDGGVVELSTNGGATWFDAGPYMVMNGYNTTINTKSNLAAKEAFSGNSGVFLQTVINLSAFQNQSVYFRFRYVTDSAGSSTGWYIDDILIRKSPAVYNMAQVLNNSNVVQSLSDTITAITSVVLPITWGRFTAVKEGNSSLLKWVTLQEFNTHQFIVQRSVDGVHYTNIATLDAAGNANSETTYTYLDEAPSEGINFYRILQTDRDGKVSYSETRSLTFDAFKNRITVSPNPAINEVVIKVNGNQSALKVKLLNATGQVIKSFTMKAEKYQLSLASLSAGVYYLKISGEHISTIKKLIKEE